MRVSTSSALALLAATSSVLASPAQQKRENWRPEGFVTTNGSQFELDGKPFFFAGTNSYWVTQLESYDDAWMTMKAVADAGLKVLRIWGFGAYLEKPDDEKVGYYQLFQNGTVEYNWGDNGIARLDRTVQMAEELGLKLVVPLVNNWDGYGGINATYVTAFVQGTNQTAYHDLFYTEPSIIAQYQDWVRLIVNRYKHSPAIFSFQLGNEPRCRGNAPQSGNCTVETLQTWIRDQSAFIKSLDPWHMVSIGSEGFFQWGSNETIYDGLYNGYDGVAFDSDLAIETIDYGTYHLYPSSWTKTDDLGLFGQKWIREHAYAQIVANKPTVLEEFGLGDGPSEVNSTKWLPAWYQTALDGNTAGIMQWQFGICGLKQRGILRYADVIDDEGCSPNDSHTAYPGNATYQFLMDAAYAQNAKSGDW